jgi:hypothetical protein
MDKNAKPAASQSDALSPKKPYEAPVLVKWGTLEEMTRSVSTVGSTDSATKGANRHTGRGGHYSRR